MKINSLSDNIEDQEDRLEVFLDPEGKYRVHSAIGGTTDSEVTEELRKHVYIGFKTEPNDSLFAFGETKNGRLGNNATSPQGITIMK